MPSKIVVSLYCAVGLTTAANGAQAPAVTDPGAAAAPPRYESAFSRYKPYQEQTAGSWRELNEEVAKAGGHVGIFGGGAAKPAASGPKAPATGTEATGQPPVRGAPAAPAAKPHH